MSTGWAIPSPRSSRPAYGRMAHSVSPFGRHSVTGNQHDRVSPVWSSLPALRASAWRSTAFDHDSPDKFAGGWKELTNCRSSCCVVDGTLKLSYRVQATTIRHKSAECDRQSNCHSLAKVTPLNGGRIAADYCQMSSDCRSAPPNGS
jgi:hypothetical protein